MTITDEFTDMWGDKISVLLRDTDDGVWVETEKDLYELDAAAARSLAALLFRAANRIEQRRLFEESKQEIYGG